MEFKPAKCPSCGGSLQVPDDKDFVKCMYCGGEVKVREAILLKRFINEENYLELAEAALINGYFQEADSYYDVILLHNIKNSRAWVGKAQIILKAHYDGEEELKKAYSYVSKGLEHDPESKPDIVKTISEDVYNDTLYFRSIPWIEKLNNLFGNSLLLRKKIVEICNQEIYSYLSEGSELSGEVYTTRENELHEIRINDKNLYEEVKHWTDESDKKAMDVRSKIIEEGWKKEYSSNSGKNLSVSILLSLGLGIALTIILYIVYKDFFCISIFIGMIVFTIFHNVYTGKKMVKTGRKETEKNIYGTNILYK